MSPDCLLGVVPQPTDSRLSETRGLGRRLNSSKFKMAPPAKRRKCTGKFQKECVAMFGGTIVQSKAGEQSARCSVCSRDVKVAASGCTTSRSS